MSTDPPDSETMDVVRSKVHKTLGNIGLLEYRCSDSDCRTQLFSTWEVDLTCNHCGKPVTSIYYL